MSGRDHSLPDLIRAVDKPSIDDEARARGRTLLIEIGREVTAAMKANDPSAALLLADEEKLALEIRRRFGY